MVGTLRSKAIEFKRWIEDEVEPARRSLEGSEDPNKIISSYIDLWNEQRPRYLILVDEYYSARGYFSADGKNVVQELIDEEAKNANLMRNMARELQKKYNGDFDSEEARKSVVEYAFHFNRAIDLRGDFPVKLAQVCESELDLAHEIIRKFSSQQTSTRYDDSDTFARVAGNWFRVISANISRGRPIPAKYSLEPQYRYVPVSEIFGDSGFTFESSARESIGDELLPLAQSD